MSQIYSQEEASKASTEYFQGDELAPNVFLSKYALRNEKDEILESTPAHMHRRLAKEFARIEKDKFKNPYSEDFIFDLMDRFKYVVPQGSPMFGIGNDFQIISISNCFVSEIPEDSYGSILKTDQQIVQISKRRGGVGTDISNLRPSGTVTRNAAKTSTGIASWMERFSNSVREVGQAGRRGALLVSCSVHHLDISTFISIKNDETKVTGANISVRLSDEFLQAVKDNTDYEQRFPVDAREKGEEPKISVMVNARKIWKEIIHSAWLRGEPGLLFWDRITNYNAVDCYEDFGFKTRSTNPCFSGDTIIAVADGRKQVSIQRLAEEGEDIPVYSINPKTEKVEVKMGRNPRKTGDKLKVVKVSIETKDPDVTCILTVTPNHKFLLTSGEQKEASDLSIYDSLFSFSTGPTELLDNEAGRVLSVKESNVLEDVYNITVDDNHTVGIITSLSVDSKGLHLSGVYTFQCGELPLAPLDSCRLLVLNYYSYVVNPFTPEAYFDSELFYTHGKIAQRLMDDIIDLEIEKVDKILEKIYSDPEPVEIKQEEINLWKGIRAMAVNGRRTGLGGTGVGDMFAALGIKYGSDKSVEVIEEIQKTLKLASYESSMEMAKEIGAFPIWDWNLEKDSEFLLKIKEDKPELYDSIATYGRRNIANLTFAPAGTVSIMTQTTSGGEPMFKYKYTRRKKINPNDKDTRVDFTDQNGDKWQEFDIYHPKFKTWMEVTGKTELKDSPWFEACADEIDWTNRIKIQAAMQRHIDHSISSTVNLPENVAEEKVAQIYENAWANGLKGITVYRNNCRSGVLVEKKTEVKANVIQKTRAPERPKSLPCDVHHLSIKRHRYYALVGLMENGDPYEVFTGSNHDHDGEILIPKSIEKGEIIKHGRGQYILKYGETEFVLTNGHSDANADTITRLVSTSLRHGANIRFVVEQLEKTQGDLFAFGKVLARTLKHYIPDGTVVDKCKKCGGEIVRENGCEVCRGCGDSRCQ